MVRGGEEAVGSNLIAARAQQMELPSPPLSLIEWEVLDAASDDVENLEQLYRMVALEFDGECWRERNPIVLLSEIADTIQNLMRRQFLVPVMDENGSPVDNPSDQSLVWRAWFRLTDDGRQAKDSSEHAGA
jgi:hypothetical protein